MVGRSAVEAQTAPAARETSEAQAGPAARVGLAAPAGPAGPVMHAPAANHRVRRAVLRRPTGPRNLIAVRAGLVTSTESADEIGPAPAGRRRLAGRPALIRPHVPAADRAQRVLDAMTAAERVKVERRAVPGQQRADLAERGVRRLNVGMTRTAPGRRVGRPERGPAGNQATVTAAVPHGVTQDAGGRTRTELPTAPDGGRMLAPGRIATATTTAADATRMLAAAQTATATTTAVDGAAQLAVATTVTASVAALAIDRSHTAAVAALVADRIGKATVAVLASARIGMVSGAAHVAAARTGMAVVRTMRDETASDPACGCHRCRPASPPISWIRRPEPS
jgi:hypothetical protein